MSVTVKQLRDALARLPASDDDREVQVWLPGSYIRLSPNPLSKDGKILVEGNLEPGSALES